MSLQCMRRTSQCFLMFSSADSMADLSANFLEYLVNAFFLDLNLLMQIYSQHNKLLSTALPKTNNRSSRRRRSRLKP